LGHVGDENRGLDDLIQAGVCCFENPLEIADRCLYGLAQSMTAMASTSMRYSGAANAVTPISVDAGGDHQILHHLLGLGA